ncbi:MAG: hypothetical protein AB2722_18140 [Candidatus Thiodiazotropha sp.]
MNKPQLWPIFICYRRVDGSATARRLHEILDKLQIDAAESQLVELDVYLDETMPGVADWKAMHRPYLERARALIFICTPGAMLNEGNEDWVHIEIDWWLAHRDVAPILIDPLMEGTRYVPLKILRRWPDIQRISLVENEWIALSATTKEGKADALRRQIVGAILPSGADIYAQELAIERLRARRLKQALSISIVLLVASVSTGGYAFFKGKIATALKLDAQATALFARARVLDTKHQIEAVRRRDLLSRLGTKEAQNVRTENLQHEIKQVEEDLFKLNQDRTNILNKAREILNGANAFWSEIDNIMPFFPQWIVPARRPPDPPHVFSVELINAGEGESVLVHYGTPDEMRLVMINGGPPAAFREYVKPRLQQLRVEAYSDNPVPIELFIVSDRDWSETYGLFKLLEHLRETEEPNDQLVDIHGIWANIFKVTGGLETFRPQLRRLIDELQIPLNQPFDRFVLRPKEGRGSIRLPGGLEIVILGPEWGRLVDLYKLASREAESKGGEIEQLYTTSLERNYDKVESIPANALGGVEVNTKLDILPSTSEPTETTTTECKPSENAKNLASALGRHQDHSKSNLASTILLFLYQGRSFLHTGDTTGDLILAGLGSANLLDNKATARVDLLSIPHRGSDRNMTVDFFKRVQASGYLFSGDGSKFKNPDIATVAGLIHARGCDTYRMYFVSRDGSNEHGAKFDDFFRNERPFNPNYRRIFRSQKRNSVIVDLIEPLRR